MIEYLVRFGRRLDFWRLELSWGFRVGLWLLEKEVFFNLFKELCFKGILEVLIVVVKDGFFGLGVTSRV